MTIISATWEVEIRKISNCGQPTQNVNEIPSQLISQAEISAPVVAVIWLVTDRKIMD
jgi:hypothetical protein